MRIPGVDLARGFALLAVFVAHTAPVGPDSPLYLRWMQISDHIAAPLFTLLLGVSAGLASRPAVGDRDSRGAFRLTFALRGVALVVLGLLSGLAGAQVVPILHYLGVVALILVPLLFLRARWLLLLSAAAVAISVAAMPLAFDVQVRLVVDAATGGWVWGDQTASTVIGFLFSDDRYRVSGLLAFALVGLAVSRIALGGRRLLALGAAGAGLIVAAVVAYLITGMSLAPYSGTAPELVKSIGLSCLVLAICCGVATTPGARFLTAVTALGTVTLTFYLAHIIVLGVWARLTPATDDSWPMVIGLCAGSLVGAWLIRKRWRHGPVEWLVGRVSRGPVRSRAAHPSA